VVIQLYQYIIIINAAGLADTGSATADAAAATLHAAARIQINSAIGY